MVHLEFVERSSSPQTTPVVCMHCEDPACARVCPADAIKVTAEGVVKEPLQHLRSRQLLAEHGRQVEADEVVTKWRAMLRLGGYARTPEYERCFPSNLLKNIAITSSRAITQIGCAAADEKTLPRIGGTLNSAWTEFWRDPSAYSAWQQANVGALGLATK